MPTPYREVLSHSPRWLQTPVPIWDGKLSYTGDHRIYDQISLHRRTYDALGSGYYQEPTSKDIVFVRFAPDGTVIQQREGADALTLLRTQSDLFRLRFAQYEKDGIFTFSHSGIQLVVSIDAKNGITASYKLFGRGGQPLDEGITLLPNIVDRYWWNLQKFSPAQSIPKGRDVPVSVTHGGYIYELDPATPVDTDGYSTYIISKTGASLLMNQKGEIRVDQEKNDRAYFRMKYDRDLRLRSGIMEYALLLSGDRKNPLNFLLVSIPEKSGESSWQYYDKNTSKWIQWAGSTRSLIDLIGVLSEKK